MAAMVDACSAATRPASAASASSPSQARCAPLTGSFGDGPYEGRQLGSRGTAVFDRGADHHEVGPRHPRRPRLLGCADAAPHEQRDVGSGGGGGGGGRGAARADDLPPNGARRPPPRLQIHRPPPDEPPPPRAPWGGRPPPRAAAGARDRRARPPGEAGGAPSPPPPPARAPPARGGTPGRPRSARRPKRVGHKRAGGEGVECQLAPARRR